MGGYSAFYPWFIHASSTASVSAGVPGAAGVASMLATTLFVVLYWRRYRSKHALLN